MTRRFRRAASPALGMRRHPQLGVSGVGEIVLLPILYSVAGDLISRICACMDARCAGV
jgi:hypothetical protein